MARAFKHLDYDIKIDFFFSEHLQQWMCAIDGMPRAKLQNGEWVRHHDYNWQGNHTQYMVIDHYWEAYLSRLVLE
jgi:hypothetical protein